MPEQNEKQRNTGDSGVQKSSRQLGGATKFSDR
jgi:hypothetical protein